MKEPVTPQQLERFFKGLELYIHFKGKVIVKVGEAIHSETGETLYLYREFNPKLENWEQTTWARPMGMFLENQPYSNQRRFKPATLQEVVKLLLPIINSNT